MGSSYSGTAGSWVNGNNFSATGATSIVATAGATFLVTAIQLEVGSSATGFEYRQYQQELALCQRYYQLFANITAEGNAAASQSRNTFPLAFPVQMRTTPTRTVITAGSYTNIRSSSSSYAGLAILGSTNTYATCSMESTSSGFMQMSNQTESMSAEL